MSRLTQADLDKGCTLAQRTPSTVQHVEESPEAPVNGYGEAGEVLETERRAVLPRRAIDTETFNVPHLLLDRNGLQFIPVFDTRGVVGVLSDELNCLIEVGSIMPARLKRSLEHLASTAREIDTAVVGFTSPVPLVGFRTPPI